MFLARKDVFISSLLAFKRTRFTVTLKQGQTVLEEPFPLQ